MLNQKESAAVRGPQRWIRELVAAGLTALLAFPVVSSFAQRIAPRPDTPLDSATRNAVIDAALKALEEGYVYPEAAMKMEQAIRARQARKEYDRITFPEQFARTLTENLREVSHDRHLRVDYAPESLAPMDEMGLPHQMRMEAGQHNFGFEKVERLAGNIGYLDLRQFEPVEMMRETAAAAMTFLANSDAVIFDLRRNGGGDPAAVSWIASYLFGEKRVHMNDIYDRPSDRTQQFWTTPDVTGKKLTGKDVYVLTSHYTFSGGEEFTYDLQTQKRATIIGETTGGGAHPVSPHRLTEHFMIGVPSGRAINPITNRDWEGTGVEPEIKIGAGLALAKAHLMALEKELAKAGDAPRLREEIEEAIRDRKKELAQ